MRLLVLAAVLAALSWSYLLPKPLDGSLWNVKVRRDVLLSWTRKDTLVFEGGKLAVVGPLAASTAPARYRAYGAGDAVQWTATTTGERGETLAWAGSVQGDRIEGTVLSTDAQGRSSRLKFSGARK